MSSKSSQSSSSQAKDKEDIEKLMAEGVRLSKQVATVEASLKKYKQTAKDQEVTIAALNTQITQQKADLQSQKQSHEDTVRDLTAQKDKISTQLEAEIAQLKQQLQDAKAQIDVAKQSNEAESKKKLQDKIDFYEKQLKEQREFIFDMERTMQQNMDQADKKIESQKKELEVLQTKCNIAESKYQEMVTVVPDATQPLLEELNALKSAFADKEDVWKENEKRLNYRIQIAESRVKLLDQENQQLQRSVDKAKNEKKDLEAKIDEWSQKFHQEMRKVHMLTEQANQIELQRYKYEKDYAFLKEQCEELETKLAQVQEELKKKNEEVQQQQQVAAANNAAQQEKASPQQQQVEQENVDNNSLPSSLQSLIAKASKGANAAQQESLEALLKQQTLQINSLTAKIEELESIKSKLYEEVVKFTSKNQELSLQVNNLKDKEDAHAKLVGRHNAALELLGAKEERIMELQQDLAYVKETFRKQVTDLLGEIDKLKKK